MIIGLADQVERLLAAGGDDQLLGRDAGALLRMKAAVASRIGPKPSVAPYCSTAPGCRPALPRWP